MDGSQATDGSGNRRARRPLSRRTLLRAGGSLALVTVGTGLLAACGGPQAAPAKPAESKPAEQKPAEAKPAEAKPAADASQAVMVWRPPPGMKSGARGRHTRAGDDRGEAGLRLVP